MDLSAISGMLPDLGPITQDLQFEPTRENSSVLQMKNNGRQNVVFYSKEFYNSFETAKKKAAAIARGDSSPVAPVYFRREMVRIVTPGDRNIYDGVAEDDHKRNYFAQYSAFRDGKNPNMGTPLKDMEFIGASELIDLNYLGVYSVEQLADASDSLCDRLPRGRELKNAAMVWVEINVGSNLLSSTKKLSADLTAAQDMILKLAKEADSRKKESEDLKAMLHALQEQNNFGQDDVDAPRKRRTKAEIEAAKVADSFNVEETK